MRSIILAISFTLLSLGAFAQNNFEENNKTIKTFFDKYQNQEGITKIEIGSAMTKIMALTLFENGDDNSAKLLRSIHSIDILVESNDEEKSQIRSTMFSLLDQCHNFELITSVNDGGELSNFYFAQHPDNEVCEFLMLLRQSTQRVVLYITGEFSVNDISALSALGDINSK